VANIAPAAMHNLVMSFLQGDTEASRKWQLGILPLVRAIFPPDNPNPMCIKTALNLMGFDMGECRAPLTTIDSHLREALKQAMKDYGLLS
jgi:4-hydroxy-tetrahydrodipicolinate synthase